MKRPKKGNVKAVWEITEKLKQCDWKSSGNFDDVGIAIGGGRGKAPKTTWEEAYENLFMNIC